jgi:predicted dehydrogenase
MLRIAIVGCGGAANGFHVPAWWSIDDVEIVAFCDLVKEKADRLAKKYHAKAYSNFSEMLSVEKPDILDVVTQPQAHAECAIAGLEAGCHVFCETPLAMSTEEARRIVESAARCDRGLGYDCNYRFSPHHRMLKEWILSGELGDACYINSFGHVSNYLPISEKLVLIIEYA